jgi:hypothetical protein
VAQSNLESNLEPLGEMAVHFLGISPLDSAGAVGPSPLGASSFGGACPRAPLSPRDPPPTPKHTPAPLAPWRLSSTPESDGWGSHAGGGVAAPSSIKRLDDTYTGPLLSDPARLDNTRSDHLPGAGVVPGSSSTGVSLSISLSHHAALSRGGGKASGSGSGGGGGSSGPPPPFFTGTRFPLVR